MTEKKISWGRTEGKLKNEEGKLKNEEEGKSGGKEL